MASALVTIVIPIAASWAEGTWLLPKSIASVLGQSYEPVELIIAVKPDLVAGEIERVLGQHQDRLRLLLPGNAENAAELLAAGIEAARGRYVGWLRPTDRYDPRKIARQVAALRGVQEPIVASCGARLLGGQGKPPVFASLAEDPGAALWPLLAGALDPSGLLVPRSCIEVAGNVDPAFAALHEIELSARLAIRFPFLHLPDHLLQCSDVPPSRPRLSDNTAEAERIVRYLLQLAAADSPKRIDPDGLRFLAKLRHSLEGQPAGLTSLVQTQAARTLGADLAVVALQPYGAASPNETNFAERIEVPGAEVITLADRPEDRLALVSEALSRTRASRIVLSEASRPGMQLPAQILHSVAEDLDACLPVADALAFEGMAEGSLIFGTLFRRTALATAAPSLAQGEARFWNAFRHIGRIGALPGASAISRPPKPPTTPRAREGKREAASAPKYNPKVTIVIPVFNGADYLVQAIESALAQTYQNIEVIVVDDGSTDSGATAAVIRRYTPRVVHLSHTENRGVAAAINTALEKLTGEFFTWLSHDDIHLPHKVAAQLAYYRKLEKTDAILFSNYELIDESGAVTGECRWDLPMLIERPLLPLLNGWINGVSLFIPVHILREFGQFDVRLRYTQDYDRWNQYITKYEFFLQPETLVRYRIHSRQGSRSPASASEGDLLWTNVMEKRSETERVQLFGSSARFWSAMAEFLAETPYQRAAAHARDRGAAVIRDTLVSVILPLSGDRSALRKAARSVLDQSHGNIELLLVGEHSSAVTGVVASLAADRRVRVLRCAGNRREAAWDRGIEAAAGEYIAFLQPDAVFARDKVEKQLAAMQHSGSVVSHTSYVIMRGGSEAAAETHASGAVAGELYPAIITSCPIMAATVMMHRSLISEGFGFGEDGEIAAWTWCALRHRWHGLDEMLTSLEPSDERIVLAACERAEALSRAAAVFAAEPMHARQQEALDTLRRERDAAEAVAAEQRARYARQLVEQGCQLVSAGRAAQAVAPLQRAAELSPSRDALVALGIAQRIAGNYAASLAALSAAAAEFGEEGVLVPLGETHAALGHLPEAMASFRRHLARHPGDDEAWAHLARSLAQRRMPEAAAGQETRD